MDQDVFPRKKSWATMKMKKIHNLIILFQNILKKT